MYKMFVYYDLETGFIRYVTSKESTFDRDYGCIAVTPPFNPKLNRVNLETLEIEPIPE